MWFWDSVKELEKERGLLPDRYGSLPSSSLCLVNHQYRVTILSIAVINGVLDFWYRSSFLKIIQFAYG